VASSVNHSAVESTPSISTPKSPRIGIVVGEASGDILGAGLMVALRARYPNAAFEGIGGPRMLSEGFYSFFAQDRLAVMGLVEPLKRLPELLSIRKQLRLHFTANPPDVFIGIDSPDFNTQLEYSLRQRGIKTVHYVSPSVWAWRQGRIKKIARAVDLMLTLFPFEADFYHQHQVPVVFVGHPLADQIPLMVEVNEARQRLSLLPKTETTITVALLPGSRSSEVDKMGALLVDVARFCYSRYPQMVFLVPSANAARHKQLQELFQTVAHELPITLIAGQSHDVMASADIVVMASGTTTLEAMLLKKPMVIIYKVAAFSYWLFSKLVKVKFIGLPNLLANKGLVPELIQDDATAENIGNAVLAILANPEKTALLRQEFEVIHHQLKQNADQKAAHAVAELIERKM
jgi:lipid-A-disaccharide synthase